MSATHPALLAAGVIALVIMRTRQATAVLTVQKTLAWMALMAGALDTDDRSRGRKLATLEALRCACARTARHLASANCLAGNVRGVLVALQSYDVLATRELLLHRHRALDGAEVLHFVTLWLWLVRRALME